MYFILDVHKIVPNAIWSRLRNIAMQKCSIGNGNEYMCYGMVVKFHFRIKDLEKTKDWELGVRSGSEEGSRKGGKSGE